MYTNLSLEIWICSPSHGNTYLHNLPLLTTLKHSHVICGRQAGSLNKLLSESGASGPTPQWTQISTAHLEFLRVCNKVRETPGGTRSISPAVNICIQPCSHHVKFKFSLLLFLRLCFPEFFFFLSFFTFFCTHWNWSNSPIPESTAKSGKMLERGKPLGKSRGEPPQMPLPGYKWWAGHSVKTAREHCTLEEKANAAAKLKISMGRLSIIPSGLTTRLPSSHCPTSVWATTQTLSRVGVCKSEWSVCVWRCGPNSTELWIFFHEPSHKVLF